MTAIEKKMIVAMLVFIGCIVVLVNHISNTIEEAGGVKQIIIDTGKEIKDISKQINEQK